MSRLAIAAIVTSLMATAAVAAPQNQLIVPNLNPGLKTVPFVPGPTFVKAAAPDCEKRLVARIDSGTVIVGADGQVAHLTGMATGAGETAALVVTSTSPDGSTAHADFVTCLGMATTAQTPIATSLPLAFGHNLRSIAVRAETNTITLHVRR